MKKNAVIKLLILNLSISIVNILLFSNILFPMNLLGYSPLTTAFSVMVIFMSVVIFGYGNYKILFPAETVVLPDWDDRNISSLEECEKGIREYMEHNVPIFAENLQDVLAQIGRMKKKKASINSILLDKFDETEISYRKFLGAVTSLEETMIINIKNLLNRITAFDEEEYEDLIRGAAVNTSAKKERITESRQQIFNEYMNYVHNVTDNNEEMLIRLDKLILEISKLNEADMGEIENMPAMREIDSLINDTKWYK